VRPSSALGVRGNYVQSTFGNEDRLPRVPLPTLEGSCERFLEWCAPLLTSDELASTEAAVAAFLLPESPARTLHAALAEYDTRGDVNSWLDAFWASRYLGRRDRIALNANYFCLFHDTGQGQIERGAHLVAAAAHYKQLLDAERIPPEVWRGRPLSMEQNRFLFSTTRIPGLVQDTIRAPYSPDWPGPSRERHIVVFAGGHLFRMDVIGLDGDPYALGDLEAGLRAVTTAAATTAEPPTGVGHLTTKPRAEWAASRRRLLDCDPRNPRALDLVETALFCVCLEDGVAANALDACDQLLHGDSANRWFDKALSFIVFGDGTAGINVEHSCLDGMTMVAFLDALMSESAGEHSRRSGARRQGVPVVDRIAFELDAELDEDVCTAAASFAAAAADTATGILSFDDFGASRLQQLGISPDAYVQMSFQLAHKRARGLVGATYEAIATRHFHHGRTEAMRVVTPEVIDFVSAMEDSQENASARRTAFKAAAAKHVERAKQCQEGLAPEQHLWELQMIQRRRGAELRATTPLALYETPGWLKLRDDYLSTSSTPSPVIRYGGFGPTGSYCIGVGYTLLPERLAIHLSAPRARADEMRRFSDALREAVFELQDLLAAEM
jgi:carnitine O-acetyltransferase